MCIWNGPLQNLNWSLKNQKSELFVWNLMVKYWSDRIKFWIYTAFRALRTSHQLLSVAVVYRRSNSGILILYSQYRLDTIRSFLNFVTILRDGEMNNIIILQHPKTLCFSPFNLTVCILSLISVKTTEGHMWNWIIFYFIFFKKEKMKWNEMRMKPCVE